MFAYDLTYVATVCRDPTIDHGIFGEVEKCVDNDTISLFALILLYVQLPIGPYQFCTIWHVLESKKYPYWTFDANDL